MKSKPNFFFKGSNLKYTAFFLGLISSLGYAPFHFFPLTIFSYLFLIYLFTKKVNHGSKVFLVSFSYALGSHLGLLYWIAISLTFDSDLNYLIPLSLVLIPYLNLADLEGGFWLISVELGKIGFLFINLKHFSETLLSGKYLEEFLCSE